MAIYYKLHRDVTLAFWLIRTKIKITGMITDIGMLIVFVLSKS